MNPLRYTAITNQTSNLMPVEERGNSNQHIFPTFPSGDIVHSYTAYQQQPNGIVVKITSTFYQKVTLLEVQDLFSTEYLKNIIESSHDHFDSIDQIPFQLFSKYLKTAYRLSILSDSDPRIEVLAYKMSDNAGKLLNKFGMSPSVRSANGTPLFFNYNFEEENTLNNFNSFTFILHSLRDHFRNSENTQFKESYNALTRFLVWIYVQANKPKDFSDIVKFFDKITVEDFEIDKLKNKRVEEFLDPETMNTERK